MSTITRRRIWGVIIALWLIPIMIYLFSQKSCNDSVHEQVVDHKIKYISLPEEISQAKGGDSLTATIKDDTLVIGFYRKEYDSVYSIVKD